MKHHQPYTTPRVCNPPGFISDPQTQYSLPTPFPHRGHPSPTDRRRDQNIPEIQQYLNRTEPSQSNPTEDQNDAPLTHTWNLKRDKAFKQILSAHVTPYDGSDCMEYRPWKTALEQKVHDLHLTATQWLQLLEKRTSGKVNVLVKQTRVIQLESSP